MTHLGKSATYKSGPLNQLRVTLDGSAMAKANIIGVCIFIVSFLFAATRFEVSRLWVFITIAVAGIVICLFQIEHSFSDVALISASKKEKLIVPRVWAIYWTFVTYVFSLIIVSPENPTFSSGLQMIFTLPSAAHFLSHVLFFSFFAFLAVINFVCIARRTNK